VQYDSSGALNSHAERAKRRQYQSSAVACPFLAEMSASSSEQSRAKPAPKKRFLRPSASPPGSLAERIYTDSGPSVVASSDAYSAEDGRARSTSFYTTVESSEWECQRPDTASGPPIRIAWSPLGGNNPGTLERILGDMLGCRVVTDRARSPEMLHCIHARMLRDNRTLPFGLARPQRWKAHGGYRMRVLPSCSKLGEHV
jgi:hypothetical protein